ncbi:MAG: hypothetical protein H6553_00050 [Chitinophagales bacterium]|nr:hypothetical protein [Chitinophagales bacterium]
MAAVNFTNMKSCDYELPPMPEQGKFTGCDGKEWDNEFLKFHLQKAVEEENYEWANECKLELERRGLAKWLNPKLNRITKLKKLKSND